MTNEPGLGTSRTYQPGEMPLPIKPSLLRRMHQELTSNAASSSSQSRAAVPSKRARVEEEVQTNETMKNLNETKGKLERMRKTFSELNKIGIIGEDYLEIGTRNRERR